VKSYEAAGKYWRISTISILAHQPTTQLVPNLSRNANRDWKSNSMRTSPNAGRTPAIKTTIIKDPDWEVVEQDINTTR